MINNPTETHATWAEIRARVDIVGALLLVTAISVQLVGLSLGGNELPWGSGWVIGSLVGSFVLLAAFVWVEANTTAIPVIPLRQLCGRNPIAIQTANLCAGTAAYAYLFMLPLFFQVVLLDSATKAGTRLAIPSLATPHWRCHCWCRYVEMGQASEFGEDRCNFDDCRKRAGNVSWVLRQHLEVPCVHLPCEPRSRNYISRNAFHDTGFL